MSTVHYVEHVYVNLQFKKILIENTEAEHN